MKKKEKDLENVHQELRDLVNPDKMYARLGVDVITLQVGLGLLCIVDPNQDGLLLPKIAALRQKLTDNLGYIIPNAKITDSTDLEENEYAIYIRNNIIATGFVYPNRYLINADQFNKTGRNLPKDVIEAEDPTHKVQVYWVNEDIAKEVGNIHSIASDDVIIQHLQEVLIKQVDFVMSETEIRKYIDTSKFDCESLLKKLSYGDIRRVLANLIMENISVKDIALILSRLDDYSRYHKEPDILSERLRKDLSRQISLTNCNKDRIIYAIDLSSELSNKLLESMELQQGFNKTKLSLNKKYENELVNNISLKLLEAYKKIDTKPVILCDEKLRLGLYRLLVKHIPTVVVVANNEIEQDIKLELVDTITI